MFKLDYVITIGGKEFRGVNHVEIKRSITSLTGTAIIKVPSTAVLKQTDGSKLNVLTSQQIKRGDAVEIELGYNGKLFKEFSGYVKRVNFTRPLEIECEDAVFLLRSKYIKKTYKKSDKPTLNKVLSDLLEGTGLSFDTGGLSINIDQLILATDSGGEIPREEALNYVLDRYGLVGYFDTDQKLFIGLRQGKRGRTTKYKLGWNTIKDDELKFHTADDMKIKIKAIYINKLGVRTEVEVGDEDGSGRTIFLSDVEDAATMKKLAQNELDKFKYDGFEGKITAFLQPFAEPSGIIEIEDEKYSQRNGSYYCDGVEVTFGSNGARRIIQIGAKV